MRRWATWCTCQRHGHESGGHRGDLPQAQGNRAAFLTTQAELPAEVLLRWERKRHQDTDLGDTHRQPPAHGHAEAYQAQLEFLQPGKHVPHHAHVLRQLLYILRAARKRLAQNHRSRLSAGWWTDTLLLEGLTFWKKESVTPVYRHCGRIFEAFSSFSGQQ